MKLTVLVRCLENEYIEHTHNSKVVLHINLGEYKILAKILCTNVSLLYKLKLPELIKDELIRDVRTVRTILEKSEKEVIK